jgi:hypothetical protein
MRTTIQDVVEEIFLESQSIDSIFRNKERYLMYRYAKTGLNKLNLSFASNLKGLNVDIPFSCKVQKPDDYYQFVRAYLINCDGRTIEIDRNQNIPEKIYHYLLNCDGTLLETCNEDLLKDECMTCNPSKGNKCDINCSTCCGEGYYLPPMMRQLLADLKKYKDSWVRVGEEFFEFSSDLEGMSVIIEYIGNQSGSLSECQIFIEEEMAEPLMYFIRWKLLENGQDTMGQSQYYKTMFKASRTKVSTSRNALSINDIYSIMLMR